MIDVEVEAEAWTAALPQAETLARTAAEAALVGREGEVVVLLSDDDAIHALNRDHRGQDKPTNVLSFPAAPSAAPHLGDVALAYETCAREAAEQGKTLEQHLQHLVAHGVLHLLGWDHMTEAEAQAMEDRERVVLAGLGAPDPYRDRDLPEPPTADGRPRQ
jgi:probable rRNA maturation factor